MVPSILLPSVEYLGKVQGNRLAQTFELSACDDRCTGAKGPKCDCQCRGKNHGTGRTVQVTVDQGGIPRVSSPNAKHGTEYREAVKAARARIVARYGERHGYEPRDIYFGRRYEFERLQKACAYRTHKNRLAALAAVCEVKS